MPLHVVLGRRAAAEVRGEGIGVQAAARSAAGTLGPFCVDTLEHLPRGGRIGSAAALVGTALAVKPLLPVSDGRIVPREKVRTSSRALARLVELAGEAAGTGRVDVAVHHLAAPDRAAALAERLRAQVPDLGVLHVSEVGAVVGAHLGPGAQGVVVALGSGGAWGRPEQ